MKFYDMSHFARSNGKETVQRAHCAMDQRTNGPMDQWTDGAMDQWTEKAGCRVA